MGSRAYLVGWLDPATGRFFDAGVYSEATPTSPNMHTAKTVVLLSTVSRFESEEGGYERATDALRRIAEKVPELCWATHSRIYRIQAANDALFKRERALGVQRSAFA